MRWTGPEQWHVTLRFLGQADPVLVGEAAATALHAHPGPRPRAVLGPATGRLGRGVLHVPVGGLDSLAELVASATVDFGQPPRPGPFVGHLTLARARDPRSLGDLVRRELSGQWEVGEVTLVSSVTAREGARYEVVRRWPI